MKLFSKKGFTLIELLVVIAVIGLLASIVLVSLGPARKKARDARRQSDVRQINLAMEMCYDDSTCGGGAEKYLLTGQCGTPPCANEVTAITTFMPKVPCDPSDTTCTAASTGDQVYKWAAGGTTQNYCVYTKMEAPSSATWSCASNKGAAQKVYAGPPTKDDCCGYDTD